MNDRVSPVVKWRLYQGTSLKLRLIHEIFRVFRELKCCTSEQKAVHVFINSFCSIVQKKRAVQFIFMFFYISHGSNTTAAFPQLKEISFEMTITLGGEVSINCVYVIQSFQKFFVFPFVKFPPPIRTAICK